MFDVISCAQLTPHSSPFNTTVIQRFKSCHKAAKQSNNLCRLAASIMTMIRGIERSFMHTKKHVPNHTSLANVKHCEASIGFFYYDFALERPETGFMVRLRLSNLSGYDMHWS